MTPCALVWCDVTSGVDACEICLRNANAHIAEQQSSACDARNHAAQTHTAARNTRQTDVDECLAPQANRQLNANSVWGFLIKRPLVMLCALLSNLDYLNGTAATQRTRGSTVRGPVDCGRRAGKPATLKHTPTPSNQHPAKAQQKHVPSSDAGDAGAPL